MRPRTPRRVLAWTLTAAALALSVPAATLAAGGGSAGDQQYTDPFAGTSPTTSTHATTTHTTTAAQSTAQTSSSAAAPPVTSTATAAPQTSTAASPSSSTQPTATIAHGQLPYTGYDSWLAGACGFTLVAAGVGLRARLRRS
ncbi:MAG: hypothetical protein ACYC0H_06825 [Solirubrobacteraceae bacterium]